MKNFFYKHFPPGKWKKTLFLMRLSIFVLVCSIGTMVASPTFSQQVKLDVSYRKVSLTEVLSDLKTKTGYQFVYVKGVVPENVTVTLRKSDATLEEVLEEVLIKNGLDYTMKDDLIVISRAEQPQQPQTAANTIRVTGRVTDDKGNPLLGATVAVNQTTRATATDADGRYSLQVRSDDVLKVTYVGYNDQTIPVEGRGVINVQLVPKAENIKEVTVTSWGTQSKESVVGAITTVRPGDLKTSNSDLTASFAGRIPGMIAWQTGGMPGALTDGEMNTQFYIRGVTSFQPDANTAPLILLDGVEITRLDLARIDPEDIDTFSVMKDAPATAMYGARGANGVILVTTKKGVAGSVYTSVRYEAIASMPTSDIDVVDPITYMKAYNEALVGRDPLATPQYSVERINRTGSGKYPSWVYPANDWYDTLFKKMSVNHHMGVNIRGGSDKVQYYASINHNRDGGMLKTDRLNQFDVNIKHNNTTFRLNLNIDLAQGIRLLVNSSSSLDSYHGPLAEVQEAYSLAFNASPVDYAPVYPEDDYHNWPHIRFGGVTKNTSNPYAKIQQGYKERSRFSTVNKVEYIHNLQAILKGLEFRANVSVAQQGYYSVPYSTTPYLYSLRDYNHSTAKHVLNALNTDEATRILTLQPSGKVSTGATQLSGDVRLIYDTSWGNHTLSYTGVFSLMEQTNSQPGSVQDGIPNRNLGLSMRLAYGFRERYFAEASFGYNGSERFDKSSRMGFFPAAGVAWIASKEKFLESASGWLSYLKLRASYGRVGNDGIISSPRFVYLQNVNSRKDTPGSVRPTQSTFTYHTVNSYENPDIKWEIAEQVNFGLETTLWNGLFEVTLDAYQEIRHNVLSNRMVVPVAVGLGYQPLDNIGKVRSRGFDFQGKVQHAFSHDFWMILNATTTFSKATYMEIEEAMDKPAWQRKIGHDISQQVGYIAEGLFRDQTEIDNAPDQGDPMPGDIRYRDINGDGVIDVEDAVHIGFPTTPRLIYGFSGFFHFKGFEFSFAFQGSGQRSFFMDPVALSPFYGDHALLKAIWNDHWSTDNMKDKPFWPRLSTDNIATHNPQENRGSDKETRYSTYFMREVSFLRCQSIELGYNLPAQLVNKLKLKNVKVYLRTNNPFIISNFKVWDVELGGNGFSYPIQKTYSVGVNVSF